MRSISVAVLLLPLLAPASCREEALQPPPIAPPQLRSTGSIEGEITIAAPFAREVKAGDTIFVMARNAATGRLVAVVRIAAAERFPFRFELTPENIMHDDTALAGKLRVEARVDKDGDPLTRMPGDLVGEVAALVPVPSRQVVIPLDRVL